MLSIIIGVDERDNKKSKAIPVTGPGGPQSCEKSRLRHFLDNRLADGGEVVSLVRFVILISVRGSVDPRAIVRLEELGQLKNPVASSGIEPTTFRLVA
jgi:hypothetical protein